LDRYRCTFGAPPRVYANHSYNRENLYWGAERLDNSVLRLLFGRAFGQPPDRYTGHRPDSPYWWGDLCVEQIEYVRNLTFSDINVLRVNPSLPYRDPKRPYVRWWFSAADAGDVHAFNHLLREENQDRLEAEGGVCIVATHFGKGFCRGGSLNRETRGLLESLAARNGWFRPVGEVLDWLRAQRVSDGLPAREWRRMQWRWAWDTALRHLAAWRRPSVKYTGRD
jgi:hypothetical protein